MIGDVNLFFSHAAGDSEVQDSRELLHAEVEIMIADPEARRKGIAREAVQMMLVYGCSVRPVDVFVAKIGESNSASLLLFEGLGFQRVRHSAVFEEWTLELPVNSAALARLRQAVPTLRTERI
eukprot:TRINITY_DN7970_c0_g1_i2.p1 TRINITY_DN7970_c0_g1~~TRINITY_DN7970_c0_g1_i2.p1  ORF type:complete len:123 (+),score=25.60 TRINITY_DN7970_c0_g1_i2:837-1205(+)